MKTVLTILMTLLMLIFSSCGDAKHGKQVAAVTGDTVHPQVAWKVTRQLDSKGNLVRYDSTYWWSYSSNGMPAVSRPDSMLLHFRKQVDSTYRNLFRFNWRSLWNEDSLFTQDFEKQKTI